MYNQFLITLTNIQIQQSADLETVLRLKFVLQARSAELPTLVLVSLDEQDCVALKCLEHKNLSGGSEEFIFEGDLEFLEDLKFDSLVLNYNIITTGGNSIKGLSKCTIDKKDWQLLTHERSKRILLIAKADTLMNNIKQVQQNFIEDLLQQGYFVQLILRADELNQKAKELIEALQISENLLILISDCTPVKLIQKIQMDLFGVIWIQNLDLVRLLARRLVSSVSIPEIVVTPDLYTSGRDFLFENKDWQFTEANLPTEVQICSSSGIARQKGDLAYLQNPFFSIINFSSAVNEVLKKLNLNLDLSLYDKVSISNYIKSARPKDLSVLIHGRSLLNRNEKTINSWHLPIDLSLNQRQQESTEVSFAIVDIVIPVFNALSDLRECLDSLIKHADLPFNLWLVNDGSTDERVDQYLMEYTARAKSEHLKELYYFKNEINRGYLWSVNNCLAQCKNHVLLLNTDTLLPVNFLSRLLHVLNSNPKIASVTPMSNTAEVYSIANISKIIQHKNRDLYLEIDKTLRSKFTDCNFEIPTAIGYCMLISKYALEEVGVFDPDLFNPMYGEENDWSFRASKLGFKNLLAGDIFIYHRGSSSVRNSDKVKRDLQLEKVLELINYIYPEYDTEIEISANKIDFLHYKESAGLLLARTFDARPGLLFIHNPELAGGSEEYMKIASRELSLDYDLIFLFVSDQQVTLFYKSKIQEQSVSLKLNWNHLTVAGWQGILEDLKIEKIFVNQLFKTDLRRLVRYITASKLPYIYFGHDYFSACPSLTLLNEKNLYCGAEKDPKACATCLVKSGNLMTATNPENFINSWRLMFKRFLNRAEKVIVPSQVARDIFRVYYPDAHYRVKEHQPKSALHYSYNFAYAQSAKLRIGIVGSIGEHKGSEHVYRLEEWIRDQQLPIELVVIGYTQLHHNYHETADRILKITGRYAANDISEILAVERVSFVLCPSLCPESFCYVVQEAQLSGFPVMAYAIGAGAARIANNSGGWILPYADFSALCLKLIELLEDRQQITEKALILKELINSLEVNLETQDRKIEIQNNFI